MYDTGSALRYDTRPLTIAGMVVKVLQKRDMMPRHRLQSPDEIETEIVTQFVSSRTERYRRRNSNARHRGRTTAYHFGKTRESIGRHVGSIFQAPTSLFQLMQMEFS